MPLRKPDVGRLVALALAIASAVALLIGWSIVPDRQGGPADGPGPGRPSALRDELLRCDVLGEAALGEARCRAAWDAHRRQFLQHRHEGAR